MSWDEPLFYNYADSIRMAYTPQALTPGFDFYQVFGRSPEDHKIYGPAYLLLARPLQQLVMKLANVDVPSAWHLVNFFAFQLGFVAFYLLLLRWFDPWPATATAAFFAWQPLFWGHAFINPKDIPFMVFFLLALVSGLWFIDGLEPTVKRNHWARMLLAGLLLGLASATRVIGPLAGVVIFAYFALRKKWRQWPFFLGYGLVSILVMFVFWPYLWSNPIQNFLGVFKHMSNNPTELAVLFDGQVYHANLMPRSYIPKMLILTLTEPTWTLVGMGLFAGMVKFRSRSTDWRAPLALLGLSGLMLAYILIKNPAVYDGFRHFFFIIPPIFLFIGFSFQWLYHKLRPGLWIIIIFVLLTPGIWQIAHLHPYEYAYYNTIKGGVSGAFRNYESDFWLTCYKEAIEWTDKNAPGSVLHIQREFDLASSFSGSLTLRNLGKETESDIRSGDLMLFNTRSNLDIRSIYRKLPVEHVIGRDSAEYCIIKRKD
jgi:uncharacterized membrane protein